MIKLNEEGYYFISDSGIRYSLLEGVTIGGKKRYTSDAIIIMLDDQDYFEEVDDHLVDYWMGATFLPNCLEEYNEDISCLVTKYEKRNNIYLKSEEE